jgi:hypothetical protein
MLPVPLSTQCIRFDKACHRSPVSKGLSFIYNKLRNLRRVRRWIQICGTDVCSIRNSCADGYGYATLRLGSRDGGRDPGQNQLEDREGAHSLEEHSLQPILVIPPSNGTPRDKLTKYRAPRLCVVVDRTWPTTEIAAPTQIW